jgi:hypothetical protein
MAPTNLLEKAMQHLTNLKPVESEFAALGKVDFAALEQRAAEHALLEQVYAAITPDDTEVNFVFEQMYGVTHVRPEYAARIIRASTPC